VGGGCFVSSGVSSGGEGGEVSVGAVVGEDVGVGVGGRAVRVGDLVAVEVA